VGPPSLLTKLTKLAKAVKDHVPADLGLDFDLGLDGSPDASCETATLDIIEDIRDSVDCLYDLVPSIEELFLSKETTKAAIQALGGQELEETQLVPDLPTPPQYYTFNIRDKFPTIDQTLAEVLGEINWARHQRIRQWITAQEESENPKPAPVAPQEEDSGLGDSVFTFQTPMPLIQGNPFSNTRSEISATSFGTTSASVSGHARVPRPPVPLSPGVKFECNICFRQLDGVDTKMLWK
jgi:hypothetical protein